MTIVDLLKDYLAGRVNAIDLIRRLSGIFNPDSAVDILTLINAITRIEQGDLDRETFKSVWKIS